MNSYAERKCELLEQKGFEPNHIAFWIENENAKQRTYGFVPMKEGATVQTLTISLLADADKMNALYEEIKQTMSEVSDYNKEDSGEDKICGSYADYDWMFDSISENASRIQILNLRMHDIEEDEPWDEVREWFSHDDWESPSWVFEG